MSDSIGALLSTARAAKGVSLAEAATQLHCDEVLLPADELPGECRPAILAWAGEYAPVHAVAHWDDHQRKSSGDFDRAFEAAAKNAEVLLARAGTEIAPLLLDHYPAVIWEDQDECLEVRPEDVKL